MSFPLSDSRSLFPFTIIHFDIWGPYKITNSSGAKGFVMFIDDCNRMTWIYLLKRKTDLSHIFPIFSNMIKNQFGVNIRYYNRYKD